MIRSDNESILQVFATTLINHNILIFFFVFFFLRIFFNIISWIFLFKNIWMFRLDVTFQVIVFYNYLTHVTATSIFPNFCHIFSEPTMVFIQDWRKTANIWNFSWKIKDSLFRQQPQTRGYYNNVQLTQYNATGVERELLTNADQVWSPCSRGLRTHSVA